MHSFCIFSRFLLDLRQFAALKQGKWRLFRGKRAEIINILPKRPPMLIIRLHKDSIVRRSASGWPAGCQCEVAADLRRAAGRLLRRGCARPHSAKGSPLQSVRAGACPKRRQKRTLKPSSPERKPSPANAGACRAEAIAENRPVVQPSECGGLSGCPALPLGDEARSASLPSGGAGLLDRVEHSVASAVRVSGSAL